MALGSHWGAYQLAINTLWGGFGVALMSHGYGFGVAQVNEEGRMQNAEYCPDGGVS